MRVLLLLAAALALPAAAQERVVDFHSDIRIARDGTLTVTERIDVQVEGREIKRGILRDFPTDYRDRSGARVRVPFEVLRVTRNGALEPWRQERLANGERVRIGNAAVILPHGRDVYEVSYRTCRRGFLDRGRAAVFHIDALSQPHQIRSRRLQTARHAFSGRISLEIDFYKRLRAAVQKLDRADRRIAQRLFGLETDMKNMSWLIRLKFYYGIPAGDLGEYNIPGGYRLTGERLRQAFMADSMKDVLGAALDGSFRPVAELMRREEELSKLYLLEIILWSYIVHEAKRTLGGIPFTIGTVLSYLILKRTEIRNLITILNGKLLKLERADIETHLRKAF